MHVILDFDYTLSRTGALRDQWHQLLEPQNIDVQERDRVAQELYWEGFTALEHARRLGLTPSQCQKLSRTHAKWIEDEGSSLVYDDVFPFFDAHGEQHRHTILTHGDPDYQDMRIQACGIGPLVDDIRIATPAYLKVQHLRELIDLNGEAMLFVDDNPQELEAVHASGLPIQLIRMNRGEGHYAQVQHPLDAVWPCISSLEELEEYLG